MHLSAFFGTDLTMMRSSVVADKGGLVRWALTGILGCSFFYLESTMQYKHLCLIFGLTPTVCGKAINWMLRRTVRLLADHPFAKVKFPDDVKMREFANMVKAREPLAEDVIGFMDGVSFQMECTSN